MDFPVPGVKITNRVQSKRSNEGTKGGRTWPSACALEPSAELGCGALTLCKAWASFSAISVRRDDLRYTLYIKHHNHCCHFESVIYIYILKK